MDDFDDIYEDIVEQVRRDLIIGDRPRTKPMEGLAAFMGSDGVEPRPLTLEDLKAAFDRIFHG